MGNAAEERGVVALSTLSIHNEASFDSRHASEYADHGSCSWQDIHLIIHSHSKPEL